jgi:outer membrane protein assembly factor BamA
MNFLLKYFLLLLIILPVPLVAQEAALTIGRVEFEGLDKNIESYLRRFLQVDVGHSFDPVKIKTDEQHLKNLTGIANVTYTVDTVGSNVDVTFNVEEAYTLFPIINFGRITGNFWYKIGFTEVNWLGRGMQLSGYYQNIDKRHNGNLFFRVPNINGSRFGGSLSLTKYASIEPLYFAEGPVIYYYDNNSIALSGTYELNYGQNIEIGGAYFVEKYEKTLAQPLEAPPGPNGLSQPKFIAKFKHVLNRINYHYFYEWGFDNQANLETVYNVDDKNYFLLFLNDTRYFKRIGEKGNLALRFRVGLSTNRETPFAPFVVSSHVNIRGVGNRINRGTGSIVLNAEYRQTVFDKKYFAAQIVAFSDAGTWRKPGGTLKDFVDKDIFRHFVGGGVRLIYKKAYNAIFRLDYGVDVYDTNSHGMVLGLGQYF